MKIQINSLTSLRFFAALAIVIQHSRPSFESLAWLPDLPYDWGVTFFFVLSGFILTHSYSDLQTKEAVRMFYVARVARIFPLHLTTILLCVALLPPHYLVIAGAQEYWPLVVAANVLLIHAWIPMPGFFFSLNGVSWSISAELFFYLMFPLLHYGLNKSWLWKLLLVALVSATIISIAAWHKVPPIDISKPLQASTEGLVYISPFVRLIEFFLGMVAAKFFMSRSKQRRCGYVWGTGAEVVALATIPLSFVVLSRISNQIFIHFGGNAWAVFLGHSGACLSFALVIYVMARQEGVVSQVLQSKVLVILGECSFALYLVHQLLVFQYNFHKTSLAWLPNPVQATGYYAIAIASALFLWRFIEKPSREWIRRIG